MLAITLTLSAISAAILVRFAQVGLEIQGATDEAKKNPLKALLGLFKRQP